MSLNIYSTGNKYVFALKAPKLLLCFMLLCFSSNSFAQQKELDAFRNAIVRYTEYGAGKAVEAGHKKQLAEAYRADIDQSFRKFILLNEGTAYPGFKSESTGRKALNMENKVSIYVTSFLLLGKPYAVYAFRSSISSDYYIKDLSKNKIVYHNNKRIPFVDTVYAIDNKHVLIVEKYGDVHTSRRAFVVKADKPEWKVINAFEGKQLIYLDDLEFKKERTYLWVECEFTTSMNAPKDASDIGFDPEQKTIFYKTYEDSKRPVIVRAIWKDGRFSIDDYDLSTHIHSFHSGAPER